MYKVITVTHELKTTAHNFSQEHHAQEYVVKQVLNKAKALNKNLSVPELRKWVALRHGTDYAGWEWHICKIEG